MKYLLTPAILLLLLSASGHAQKKDPDDPDGLMRAATDRRWMNQHDTLYSFLTTKPEQPIKTRPDKLYYWFNKDTIMTTIGGYAGRLLDGEYKVFYPNKTLKEMGNFRLGLKTGIWKIWYPNGNLASMTQWKDGEKY